MANWAGSGKANARLEGQVGWTLRRWGTVEAMSEDEQGEGIRDRLSRQGEETLGKIAEELVGNPLVASALARAFEAREKAVQAQEVTMGALGIPSAADI